MNEVFVRHTSVELLRQPNDEARGRKQPAGRRAAASSRSLKGAMRGLLHANGSGVAQEDVKMLLARLSDAMLEGLMVFGQHGEIAYVNENLCQMLGCSREELVGKPASKYFGPLYGRSLLADPALPADRYEVRLAKKGGDALVVQVSAQRVETEEGRHLGCFAVLMDITARANAEAALRRSESDLRLLSAQLLSAQELERQRIARELHDGIGQAMGGIKFSLESCAQSMAAGASPAHAERLRELAAKMQGVVEEVRRISMNLRPSTLDDLGILPTLGWFCREFQAVYGQFHVETMVDVLEDAIAPQVKTAIYRIVQEAFNNVVVHSRARNISLDLTIEDGLIELRIQDDGSGFEPKRFASTDDKARGLGLASMRERAEATGGRFRLVSERGRGTRIHARWPGPASAAQ